MAIRFQFSLEKAVQAVGVLMRAHGRARVPYFRILKLLYLADRGNIERIGKPITGDVLVVMKNGPAASTVYNFMKAREEHPPEWDAVFSVIGNELQMTGEVGADCLSANEVGLLQRIVDENRAKDRWRIAEELHELPEVNPLWEEAKRFSTSLDIPFEDIIRAVGRAGDLDIIAEEADAARALSRITG